MTHTPVLTKEVMQYLDPGQNENFVDCTMGEGGHTSLILEKNGPDGKVLGIDLDPHQVEKSHWLTANFNSRMALVNDNYANLKSIIERNNFSPVNGVLLDLGMSSVHIDETEKGFTFKANQALDMRYDMDKNPLTAEQIINDWPQEKIEKIIEDYGQDRYAKKIAQKIAEARGKGRIKTTSQLVEVIKSALPKGGARGKIHFATRVFQALRIAVNDELENIKKVLPQAVEILAPGGRLAVISFHSLEDKIVKEYFKEESKKGTIKLLFKKPVTASAQEQKENPRSRSAKLRVAIKQ